MLILEQAPPEQKTLPRKPDKVLLYFFMVSGFVFILAILIGVATDDKISVLDPPIVTETFWGYFSHNISIAISIVVLGSLTASVYAHTILFLNGYILGKLLGFLFENKRHDLILTGLLPHAIFEIAGLLTFATLSFIPAFCLYQYLKNNKNILEWLFSNKLKLIISGMGGMALIVLAAWIEANISHFTF